MKCLRTLVRDFITRALVGLFSIYIAFPSLARPVLALSNSHRTITRHDVDTHDRDIATSDRNASGSDPGTANPQNLSQDLPAEGAIIVVADRTLTGPFSSIHQRGGRIFLPIAGIARALGDEILTNAPARIVEVRRQTGSTADFRAALNQVRENGSVILVVSNSADIVFPPNQEELMLPVEIVSALLDISVIIDNKARAVRITRTQQRADSVRAGSDHGRVDLYLLDYTYNFNLFSSSLSQYLTLHSIGRIGDGRFEFLTNVDGGGGQKPITYRTGTFTFERPNGQKLIAGDFGTGTDLQFMSSVVRGFSMQQPLEKFRLTAFGGQVGSNPLLTTIVDPLTGSPSTIQTSHGLQYDTTVLGSYLTFGASSKANPRGAARLISSGVMYFNGPERSGAIVTGSVRSSSRRNQFQSDFGTGTFSGTTQVSGSSSQREVNGGAFFIDASDVLSVGERMTLQGRYTYVGQNFLSPQTAGFLLPMTQVGAGVSLRATKWLSGSINANTRSLLGGAEQRDRSLSGSVSVTPRGPFPSLLFTQTETRGTLGNSSYTLLNATKELNRWRLFGNYIRIRNALYPILLNPVPGLPPDTPGSVSTAKPPSESVSIGSIVRLNSSNTLQITQSFGTGPTYGGDYDWLTSSFFTKRITLGAGFGYSRTATRLLGTERFLSTIELPFRQILQVTYVHSPTGSQLYAQLRGALIKSKRADAIANVALSEMNSLGAFYGKVFQDVNLNGRYDAGVDVTQGNVQVRVDGNFYATTDANGDFRIENVKAGIHSVYLDLLSVRADLTLLDNPQQSAFLQSGRDAIVDFRLVRTGRIRGTVWLDENENGKLDQNEKPLADVRVVTGSGRDTLTDADGQFVLGDLPPGDHIILLDEKTLPDNMRSAAASIQVNVKPGSETSGVNLPVIAKPREVNVRRFPSNNF